MSRYNNNTNHNNHNNNHNQTNGPRIMSNSSGSARILCIADIRGQISSINSLAQQYEATHVLHTGDFGFYDNSSLDRMTDKTLKHVIQYSPLVPHALRSSTYNTHPSNNDYSALRKAAQSAEQSVISELQDFLDGKKQLQVPLYTVWGACEDVRVLEKFRSQEYKIPNLNIVDEAASKLLSVGGLNIRLLGLGGAVVLHKLFDNGEGKSTIAGGQGTMWTTVLQIGELLHTADRTFSASETRILMTHHSPGREGLLSQLAHTLKADFTISAGLHFRYGSSYNDFSVSPSPAHYSQKLALSRSNFLAIHDVVKPELASLLSPPQSQLLESVLAMVDTMPKDNNDVSLNMESSFKNTWNFNLPDSQFGSLILEVKDGRVSEEMRSQGFNFGYRRGDKNDREKQRTTSQAQIAPTQKNPQVQAPQSSQAAASVKPEKAATPPVTKPQKAQKPALTQTQQVAASTPLPEPTSTEPAAAPASNSGSEATAQIGLWVSPCPTDERAKEIFPSSIGSSLKSTNAGRQYAYVFFATVEDLQAAQSAWDAKADKEGVMVKEMIASNSNRNNNANRANKTNRNNNNNRGQYRRGRGRGGSTSAAKAE